MRRVCMLIAVFVVVLTQVRAANQRELFYGRCPDNDQGWWTVVEFNEDGIPISAAGVCCDGSVWSRSLLPAGPGGGTTVPGVAATLHWSNDIVVSVSADEEVDFRIVDLRTGNFMDSAHHYYPGGQLEINISTLPIGAYGVAVIQNGTIFNLLTFARL